MSSTHTTRQAQTLRNRALDRHSQTSSTALPSSSNNQPSSQFQSQPSVTTTQTVTQTNGNNPNLFTIILQRSDETILRNQQIRDNSLHVTWDESVIDNEFMNKKSSKKCCIFRKPKNFDQSSDESGWEDPDPVDEE